MSEKRVLVTVYANTIGLLSHFCLFVFLYSSSFFLQTVFLLSSFLTCDLEFRMHF